MKNLITEALAKAIMGLVFSLTVVGLTIMTFLSLVVIYATVYAYLHVSAETIQKTHLSIDKSKR